MKLYYWTTVFLVIFLIVGVPLTAIIASGLMKPGDLEYYRFNYYRSACVGIFIVMITVIKILTKKKIENPKKTILVLDLIVYVVLILLIAFSTWATGVI